METENQLIEKYKQDFAVRIGKVIEIRVLDKWDELCYFDREIPFWKLVRMIFDATGWDFENTFKKSRCPDWVDRRRIIDLIAVSNGLLMLRIGKDTGRDHTTVLYSVRTAKGFVETDPVYRKFIREIMNYIRENYMYYKDKNISKEECME